MLWKNMVNERERTSELVGIITATETKHKTHIEITGPTTGDGHSFGNEYDREEIIDKTWYVPKNSFLEMRGAKKELKVIYQNTTDEDLRAICEGGINHEHVEVGLGKAIIVGAIQGIVVYGSIGYFIYLIITN